jgi:hypothetical protein
MGLLSDAHLPFKVYSAALDSLDIERRGEHSFATRKDRQIKGKKKKITFLQVETQLCY